MDQNDMNRDALLNQILRETAQRPAAPEPQPAAPRTPQPAPNPNPAPASRAAAPQTRPASPAAEPAPAPAKPKPAAPRTAAQPSRSFRSPAVSQEFTGTRHAAAPEPAELADPLYEDLEGESQPGTRSSSAAVRTSRKRKPHRVISALVMTIVIIAVSVLLSTLLIVYGRDLLGINSDSTTKIVTIPQGASMNDIAETLQKEDIISKPSFFVFIAGMSNKDKDIKPGDHELRPDMAYETILSELVSDPMDSSLSVSITFPEGIRLCDAADLLEENNVCDADAFLNYFNNDPSFGLAYESHMPSFQDEKFYKMEGYLFPDTYTFYQEMDVELVCQKILENFNSKIPQEYYDRMAALNISLDDVITLASMIQAEAGSVDQMANISSVFWNRLNHSAEYQLLQSDPTTKYVEEVIKPHSEDYNQTLFDSYDTYVCTGLPAGAIDNPGSEAIYAALYPADTSYYYFYSNVDTKETYFASTLEQHEANQKEVEAQRKAAGEDGDSASDGSEDVSETEDSDDTQE